MTDKLDCPAPLDRWTGAQAEKQDDDCHCVHAAEALATGPVENDPAMERLAEIIAQRG